MEAFIGTILPVGFNFAPRGWAFCNGQTLPIAQNSALFALLGTMYGGDGQTTFGLPDLRGRTVVGSQGNGPGLAPVNQGEKAGTNNTTVISTGTATVALTQANLPAHTHTATASLSGLTATSTLNATSNGPGSPAPAANATLSSTGTGPTSGAMYLATTGPATNLVPLNTESVSTVIGGTVSVTNADTGNGTPLTVPVTTTSTISNMQPYLGLNYIICMEGIFPSRN
ncbi:tail fiber protein [Methylobacter sp.]|uniref:phage tail protein n=1 Tax=Methylobacter sp. TaxID=2051955 RepID=UPI0011FD2DA8|nr:tail fiber protein [Methylobacter sp.]TAK60159.1 MAG: phage tail protein [Methylobacter sp.]